MLLLQDYTAAIELDGAGELDDVEHDLELPRRAFAPDDNSTDRWQTEDAPTIVPHETQTPRVAPPSLPTPVLAPVLAPPKTPPERPGSVRGTKKAAPSSFRGLPGGGERAEHLQEHRHGKAEKGGSNSGQPTIEKELQRSGQGIGSVVGSHTPAFHPLTATHGRYPRVPMSVGPPSPRAAKTQREAEAARMNGNSGMRTDRPIAPPRPEVQVGWDRPSTAPAHKRGTFGTSYTVPRIPSDNHMSWPDEPRIDMKTPTTTAEEEEVSPEQLEAEWRAKAMARLFPAPVANFKAPALKGRNMKEAAMNLPEGHFAVGGRVYKIAKEDGAEEQQQLPTPEAEEGEAMMAAFLANKQPDAVPPWMLHLDAKGIAAAKASTSRPGTAPDSAARRKAYAKQKRGCTRTCNPHHTLLCTDISDSLVVLSAQGRRQQLGAFGSGRSNEAGAGGRPWSPAEPRVTVDIRAMTVSAHTTSHDKCGCSCRSDELVPSQWAYQRDHFFSAD